MQLDRRSFLTTAAATAALASTSRSSWGAPINEDIRVATIGVRSRGRFHMDSLGKNLVAICDMDQKILANQAEDYKSKNGRSLETFTDYRKLLERDDIDAVTIATPNHTHSLISIAAIQAGKDVYTEKPISHNIWESRQLVAAAEQSDRIVQCGTQSRSYPCLQKAVAWIQSGALGKIQYVLGTCYKPRKPIGKLNQPLLIPGTIDYDLWCGPAAKVDLYRPQFHYDWHWDWNTGNGDMGNQGIHQMDIARWFLGEEGLAPRTISIGGRLGYEDAANTPNTQVVYHDYEAAPLIFETRGLPRSKAAQSHWADSMNRYRGSNIGVLVQCEKGHFIMPNHHFVGYVYDRDGNEVKRWTDEQAPNHHANWLEAVTSRDASALNAPIQQGHLSSSLCHTGGVSHQLGKKVATQEIAERVAGNDLLSQSFDRMANHLRANNVDVDGPEGALSLGPWLEIDPSSETFVGNDAATALRSREVQRAGFAVPDLGA